MFKTKLVISRERCGFKEYIGLNNEEDYYITKNQVQAVNFRWIWLFWSKRDMLKGINERFGSGWKYEKVEK